MTNLHPASAEHQRKRWQRTNAHLYIRQDAYRFMPSGSPRYVGKGVVRCFWSDPVRDQPPQSDDFVDPAQLAADRAELLAIKSELAELIAIRRERAELQAITRELAKIRFEIKYRRLMRWLALKAGYRADQPRVPAGSREGGQWTNVGSGGGGAGGINDPRVVSDIAPVDGITSGERYAALKRPGGRNDTPPNPPPEIPQQRPPTIQERNLIAKLLARSSIAIEVLAAGPRWLYEHLAAMQAYRDPPKTLEELQDAVQDLPKAGYQKHHIVEQTIAERDGYPRSRIDARDNLAAVPKLRHEDINGWFAEPNGDKPYYGLSPRDYLRGKEWSERYRIGIEAMIRHRVLKP